MWRATVGYGYSALCITGDYVYTMGHDDRMDTVFCLLADNGREVWRYGYPCEPGTFAGPRATPVHSDGLVYTVSQEGLPICSSAKSGKVMWQKDLAKDANAEAPTWGISSSVVIKDHMLLLNVGKLYGVHGNTVKRKGNSWDVGRRQGALCCVDFLTGETLWEEGVGIASLIIVDGKLIVLNERGTLFIAEATPEGYHELASAQVHVRGEDSREAKGKCWTAPVFCRGKIYCRNDRGAIVCIDMRDGTVAGLRAVLQMPELPPCHRASVYSGRIDDQ